MRGPSAKNAKRVTAAGCDSSCRPWVPGLAALARDTSVRGRGARSEPFAAISSRDVTQHSPPRSRATFVRRGSSFLFASIPQGGGGGAPTGALFCLCRACEARRPRERNAGRPVATGTPSRRSVVAIFGRGPVLPPPAVAPEPMSTCPRQALRPDGRGPGPPALRFAPQSRDATPRSIVRIVSGGRPL